MFKEMATLIFILWCTQVFSAPTVTAKYRPTLESVYCDAEQLLREYANDNFFSPLLAPSITNKFSGVPNCTFTKKPQNTETCEIIQAFHELFDRLNKTSPEDRLLKPVMDNRILASVVEYQGKYLRSYCSQVEPTREAQIRYQNIDHKPTKENMFYYIFEQYKNCTQDLCGWQLPQKVQVNYLCPKPTIHT